MAPRLWKPTWYMPAQVRCSVIGFCFTENRTVNPVALICFRHGSCFNINLGNWYNIRKETFETILQNLGYARTFVIPKFRVVPRCLLNVRAITHLWKQIWVFSINLGSYDKTSHRMRNRYLDLTKYKLTLSRENGWISTRGFSKVFVFDWALELKISTSVR